ncbi:barstar family protein [Bulleidia sp. zg-1006]|uniref:barstar family protein n=1 Tax=Bulleidia sp. zg-1006 TaxID=2806552 RepID=UPI00193A2B09|nr:barstar family protein [Bulleidia sp. zg-1006]QRG86630.1 barstar family protein [Bulleidia sp. zg-1006]
MEIKIRYSDVQDRKSFMIWVKKGFGWDVNNLDALADCLSEGEMEYYFYLEQADLAKMSIGSFSYCFLKMLVFLVSEEQRFHLELI